MGTFTIGGTAKDRGTSRIDPRLVDILQRAAVSSPYNVQLFSGIRPGDRRYHGRGTAVDIVLSDPATGREIPNLKSAVGFPIYEEFAKTARAVQQETYPDLAESFRWGGYFSGGKGKYGAVDLMHFDLGPTAKMAGGSWETGLTPAQAKIVANMGEGQIYSGEGQRKAGPGEYANLWGREPMAASKQGDPAVIQLQTYLAQNGFDPGPVNGVMSEQTMTALNGYNAAADPEGDALARVMLAEARGEGADGMAAVAWVARNRTMDQSGLWPKDIAGVVSQKGQFAPPLDDEAMQKAKVSPQDYAEAFRVASQVRSAPPDQDPTQGATYFKTGAVNPRWASVEPFKGQIGNHQFYGQVKTEAPTMQMAYADAIDRFDVEAPAQQAIDDMLTGQSSEQVLAGGPRTDPRRAAPATGPIAPEAGSFARSVADVLDEGPNMDPRRAIASAPIGPDMGGMRSPEDVLAAGPRLRPGGAPDASVVPDPQSRLASGVTPPPPQSAAMPNPRPRASGLPDPTLRPDINDPSLSFNASEYAGGGPTAGPAPPDASRVAAIQGIIDQGIRDPNEIWGYLNMDRDGNLIGDISPSEIQSVLEKTPYRAESAAGAIADEFGPGLPMVYADALDRFDTEAAATTPSPAPAPPPPPITEENVDSLGLAQDLNADRTWQEWQTGELRPQASPPPAPFGRAPEIGNLNYSDMPSGRLPQTQAAVMEPDSGAGPYGNGIPPAAAFDVARMDDGLKAPISLPETYAQLLDMPEGMNEAEFGTSYYPGLLPLEREVTAGASPDQLSLDAMPDSDTARFFNANQPTTSTVDRVMSILDEGREPTVSLAGGPRETSIDWSQPGSGQWMTNDAGNSIISRGQGWWESPPEPELAGIPQGDSDWSPTTANAATMEAPPVAQSVMADALDAADSGSTLAASAAVQPGRGPDYRTGLPPIVYQPMAANGVEVAAGDYHPGAQIINPEGAAVVAANGGSTAPAPVIVQAPQLGGGRLNGTSGGLFGMGANWAGPQWTGDVTTGMSPSGQWWSGDTNAMGGSTGLTWTGSDGRTITAYDNSSAGFGQPGYTMGYGPQV